MSRTPLFRWLRKHMRQQVHSQMDPSKRQFAKALGLAAVSAALPFSALRSAIPSENIPRIAIIGAGLAGLTTAYRLQQAGMTPVVFEASTRIGGRVHTRYGFTSDGQFCELGGEFVDSNHSDIRALCVELGVGLSSLAQEGTTDLFFFDGTFYSQADLEKNGERGVFRELAGMIARDAQQLYEAQHQFTDHARALDQVSLATYLARTKQTPSWVLELIRVAYTGEFGLDPDDQSCLNLVDMMGADAGTPFSLFGDSDEAWRIEGGSSRLIEALMNAVTPAVTVRTRSPLVAIRPAGSSAYELSFAGQTSSERQVFDYVVLALPFTILRGIKGLDQLLLSNEKRRAIEQLGYGTNAKILFEMQHRNWSNVSTVPQGVRPNGTFYSDLAFQNIWDTSRGQQGEHGILTTFVGGEAGLRYPADLIHRVTANLKIMLPEIETQFTGNQASFFWAKHRFSLGAYTCAKPGQYTALLPHTAGTEGNGRLFFAGEHTSQAFQGYMNGAVESGNRVARELLQSIRA